MLAGHKFRSFPNFEASANVLSTLGSLSAPPEWHVIRLMQVSWPLASSFFNDGTSRNDGDLGQLC